MACRRRDDVDDDDDGWRQFGVQFREKKQGFFMYSCPLIIGQIENRANCVFGDINDASH